MINPVSELVRGDSTTRIRQDVNVVNVVAIQRGRTDPNRYVLLSGDIDSRVSDVLNATSDSPGANDNATGVAAMLGIARVIAENPPKRSVVFVSFDGEEGLTRRGHYNGGRRGSNVFARVSGRPVPDWASDFATSWAQFFLKYVISHPAITCAIPGTTKLSHLKDNQAAARGTLPDAAMRKRMEAYWDGLS